MATVWLVLERTQKLNPIHAVFLTKERAIEGAEEYILWRDRDAAPSTTHHPNGVTVVQGGGIIFDLAEMEVQ